MTSVLADEIMLATQLAQKLEELIVKRGAFPPIRSDRDLLLIAYWSLMCEYNKGILSLVQDRFYAPAFALLRPIVETVVRCHVAKFGSDEEVNRLQNDQYSISYEKDGARIDQALGTGELLDSYLKGVRPLLHSFTHSGKAQLARRFSGNDIESSFNQNEVVALIAACSSTLFMVTVLITRHFDFNEEWQSAQVIWNQYGNRSAYPSIHPDAGRPG
jgi:hypothetical protein